MQKTILWIFSPHALPECSGCLSLFTRQETQQFLLKNPD
jgi:hypothetical protein